MKRRGMLFGLISLASVPFVGKVADASVRDAALWEPAEPLAEKPLTTEGMARVLLVQSDKAKQQGLVREATILRKAALDLLALPERVGVVPLRDGGGDDPLDLRRNLESY